MPLYVLIYLFLFFLFAFGSTYMHFEEGRGFGFILLEIMATIFLVSFLIMYYYPQAMFLNKFAIAFMLLYTISWEVLAFRHDMQTAKSNFGIKGRELMLYTGIGIIFILPNYIAGFALLFK